MLAAGGVGYRTSYNGAAVVALAEIMPAHVRSVGFSLAYSLATAVFGGLTPMVSTWLIEVTGDKAAPGYWMAFAAACGLAATLLLYHRGGNLGARRRGSRFLKSLQGPELPPPSKAECKERVRK